MMPGRTLPYARSDRPRAFVVGVVLAVAALVPTGCSGDEPENATLDQVAPTKADVARDAGVVFPDSTRDFRLVRISGDQIDLTFTIDPADVEQFATDTGVELTEGRRTIAHASPLWDVAVTGDVSGGSSSRNGITRDVEVVAPGTVRLSLLKG